ncbi:MAG: glutaredoxin family protein [Verrucomicrobiia bacterium]
MSESLPKLYVKTGCPWCAEVMEFLDGRGIKYERVVVTGNPEAMDTMVRLSGQSKAPTLDWHGEVLADFGAQELEPFLVAKGVI